MRIGKFDFIKSLGSGNFGEVWLAKDVLLNHHCAIKRIQKTKLLNPNNFHQEAQVMKAAEHPNIVQVNEAGELTATEVYVSMEYLQHGCIQPEKRLSYVHLRKAQQIMVDVLRGLDYAHMKRITHRDIKPNNILIGDTQQGKLSDFGLAMPMLSEFDRIFVKERFYIAHLAPEVQSTGTYTYLSDIFACGLTLYRLINGEDYFKRSDKHSYREFIPQKFVSVIDRATDPNPAKRFQSAADMRRALEDIPLQADWEESTVDNGMQWKSTNHRDDTSYIVERTQNSSGTWNITTRKGKALRRITERCHSDIPQEGKAIRATQKIFHAIAAGKL